VGTFSVMLTIGDPAGLRWEAVEAVVDTAVSYTWVLERLCVASEGPWPFQTPDGRLIERDIAETRARLDGQERTTIVVFGVPGSRPLIGAYTLEGFGVVADPVNRRLVQVPGLAL
jgi:predicted aspartyl protease